MQCTRPACANGESIITFLMSQDSRSSNRHFMRVSILRMPFSILQLESRLRENFLLRHKSRRCEVLERVLKLSPLLCMTLVRVSPFLLLNHLIDKLLWECKIYKLAAAHHSLVLSLSFSCTPLQRESMISIGRRSPFMSPGSLSPCRHRYSFSSAVQIVTRRSSP